MRMLISLIFIFGAAKECEVDRHFEGLLAKFAKDERNCNDQNFHLHMMCSLLVSRNFRKFAALLNLFGAF